MGVTYTTATGATYVPIATTTVTGAVSSVTLSSISSAYTDLVLIVNSQTSNNDREIRVQVGNGSVDTGTNYSWTSVLGYQGSASGISQRGSTLNYLQISASSSNTVPSIYLASFMNYSNTSTYKTMLSRGNTVGTVLLVDATVSLWRSTSAINIMTIFPNQGVATNFSVGSTFTLYGILSA